MSLLMLVPTSLEVAGLGLSSEHAERLHVCGVGPVAAGLETLSLLASRRPDGCVLIGLAGTRDPESAALGDLVVGTAVRNEAVGAGAGADFLSLREMGIDEPGLPPDDLPLAPPGPGVLDAAPAGEGVDGEPIRSGVIGTVGLASANAEQAAGWRARHPEVLVEEMEGYGVALACQRTATPLSIIRAVSNVAGERDHARWRTRLALERLGQVTRLLLKEPVE